MTTSSGGNLLANHNVAYSRFAHAQMIVRCFGLVLPRKDTKTGSFVFSCYSRASANIYTLSFESPEAFTNISIHTNVFDEKKHAQTYQQAYCGATVNKLILQTSLQVK